MTSHLTEEALVLHYYSEMSAAEEAEATEHLSRCAECHEQFRRLQRILTAIDEQAIAVPELPEHFERLVWAKLQPDLVRERRPWLSWFVLSPGRLAWVASVVLLVAVAFMAGRLTPRVDPTAPSGAVATTAGQLRERILLVDLGEHLEQSQMVLVQLVSGDEGTSADRSAERDRAGELVAANRLYRQTALSTGDTAIADLLDELERVLVDIAASPSSASGLDAARKRIESGSLLFKVRVVSSEVRQRQRTIVQERAGQRSSL